MLNQEVPHQWQEPGSRAASYPDGGHLQGKIMRERLRHTTGSADGACEPIRNEANERRPPELILLISVAIPVHTTRQPALPLPTVVPANPMHSLA